MNKPHFLLATIIFTFITTVFFATPTSALDGITLQISPTSHKIALEPGNEYSDSISIQNLSDTDFEYKMSIRPYQAQDILYHPDYTTENSYTQITKWITFAEPSGTLAAHSSKKIDYNIKVPTDVPAGGQYAILIAETPAQANPGAIELISSVGSLLYAHVSGDTREAGNLIKQNIWPLQISSPITAESTIENTGNVDFDVTTTLKVTKVLGGNTVYDNSEDPSVQTVLPNSKRLILSTWYDTPKLGLFEVTQTTSFLDQSHSVQSLVLVCPLWLVIVTTIIIVLLIVLLIYNLVTHFKKRSKHTKSLN